MHPKLKRQVHGEKVEDTVQGKDDTHVWRRYINGKLVLFKWNPTQGTFKIEKGTDTFLSSLDVENDHTNKKHISD